MIRAGGILTLFAETNLHPGTGQGVGSLDRPIQRDRVTDLPIIYFSGIKGALRRHLAPDRGEMEASAGEGEPETGSPGAGVDPEADKGNVLDPVDVLFGNERFGGSVSPTDARLLLLPVSSLHGLFAWVTCPYALSVLNRDARVTGVPLPEGDLLGGNAVRPGQGSALVASLESPPVIRSQLQPGGTSHPDGANVSGNQEGAEESGTLPEPVAVLDGLVFRAIPSDAVARLASWVRSHLVGTPDDDMAARLWRENEGAKGGESSIVVVDDDAFRDFCKYATVVQERNTLSPAGTSINLWTEEHLPAYSLLYSPLSFNDARTTAGTLPEGIGDGKANELLAWLSEGLRDRPLFQIGGDATLGRGFVRARLLAGNAKSASDGKEGGETDDPEGVPPAKNPGESGSDPAPLASGGGGSIYRRTAQEHARFAYENVEKVTGEGDNVREHYRTVVRDGPALLRQAGLESAVAFWLAKARAGDEGEGSSRKGYELLYQHLEAGVLDPERAPGGPIPGPQLKDLKGPALLLAIRESDSAWIRMATRRVEDLLTWHKRVTEALLGSPTERAPDSTHEGPEGAALAPGPEAS